MEESKILASLEEAQTLINKVKLESVDLELWIQAFSQLDEISNSLMDRNSEDILEEKWVLEALSNMVNEVDGSLQHIKEHGDIKGSMYDIFIHMMNILWRSFTYCQIVGTMCTDKFEVNENLASFFKLSYQNVKVILDILETYSHQLFQDTTNYLLDMIVCLIKCSQVLADIDIMASVAVWKSVKRLFTFHKDLILANHSEFTPLFDVCDITCQTLTTCFDLMEKTDGNMLSKYQKVSRFFLGIVLLFTKEFKNVMNSKMCCQVYELIHLIQRLSLIETRNNYDAKGCLTEYESSYNTLLCVNDPLMKDFVEAKCSAQCILEKFHKNYIDAKYEDIVYLMDIMDVMDCLTEKPECINQWMESSSVCLDDVFEETTQCFILDVLFSSVDSCSPSMFKQSKGYVVIDKSKCLKEATFYEIVLGKLCAFVSTLPSKYFKHLELVMLSNILINSKYCVLLASDLWCFISRWGKAELCLNHFVFLSKLLVHLHQAGGSNVAISNISHLLQRLFWLLEDNQHEQILLSLPITSTNIVVWKVLPLSHLIVANKFHLCSDVVETVLSMMELKEKKENSDNSIVCAIECLSNIITDRDMYANIAVNTKQRINEHIYEFWSCFQNFVEEIEINESLVVTMLALTSKFLPYLEDRFIYDTLSIINDILQNTDSQTFRVKCAYFLTLLKDIKFPIEIESNCLLVTSKMFQYLMSCEDWIVDSCCMKALQMFAEETVYPCALVTFLPQSRKKDFTNFLRKEVCTIDMQYEKVFNIIQHLSHQNTEDKMIVSEDENTYIVNIINKIEKNVRDFDDFVKGGSLISDYIPRVKAIISILENSCR